MEKADVGGQKLEMALTKQTSAAIDYLTCSLKPTNGNSNLVWAMSKAVKDSDYFEAVREKTWSFYGYRGFVMMAGNSGHFAYGEHPHQGFLVQMSGQYALRFWFDFLRFSDNVSRFDINVDAELYIPMPHLCQMYQDWIEQMGYSGRRFTLIKGLRGFGQTLYVGSRRSEEFGRIYDKSAQTGKDEPGKVWRYEVEYKKATAKAVATSLLEQFNTASPGDFAEIVTSIVYRWFDNRYCTPVWDFKGKATDRIKVHVDGSIGKIEWLRTQVSPSVRSLIMAGKEHAVIDALGLSDFFDLTRKK